MAPGQPLESQLLEAPSTAEGGKLIHIGIERECRWLDPGLLPLKSNRLII